MPPPSVLTAAAGPAAVSLGGWALQVSAHAVSLLQLWTHALGILRRSVEAVAPLLRSGPAVNVVRRTVRALGPAAVAEQFGQWAWAAGRLGWWALRLSARATDPARAATWPAGGRRALRVLRKVHGGFAVGWAAFLLS